MLTDDIRDSKRPTKANILSAINWLVKDAKAHDSLFFHCTPAIYTPHHTLLMLLLDSGHGGQIPDTDGDEADGYDEGERG